MPNFIKEKINTLIQPKPDTIFMCPLSKLKFDPEYKSIYAQESLKVKRIAENMEMYGDDVSQVIIINPSWHILDGNSRREALDLLEKKIEKVPVCIKDFATREEYKKYVLHLQLDRRSTKDIDKFKSFLEYEELKKIAKNKGENLADQDLTDEKISERLGMSLRQLSMLREVSHKITADLEDKLYKEEMSLSKVYSHIKKSEKQENPESLPKEKKTKFDLESARAGMKLAFLLLKDGKSEKEVYSNSRISDGVKSIDFSTEELSKLDFMINQNVLF